MLQVFHERRISRAMQPNKMTQAFGSGTEMVGEVRTLWIHAISAEMREATANPGMLLNSSGMKLGLAPPTHNPPASKMEASNCAPGKPPSFKCHGPVTPELIPASFHT